MEEIDWEASTQIQETRPLLRPETRKRSRTRSIVDLDLVEDTAADGRMSSLRTTSVRTSEPEERALVGAPEHAMAVAAIHEAETDRL